MSYTPDHVRAGVWSRTQINANLDAIKAELDKTLFRYNNDPQVGNEMFTDLDMNDNRVLNVPEPQSPLDVVRIRDFLVGGVAYEAVQEAIENLVDSLNGLIPLDEL